MKPVARITSASNARYRGLLKLRQSSRERREAGRSLLDGTHLVAAYLQHIGAPAELIVSTEGMENAEVAQLVERSHIEPLVLSGRLFSELSTVATPTGIMAVVSTPRPAAPPAQPGPCIVLEDIQDPGNLGSILRSAAAAGLDEVYLSTHAVQAWSPRVLRAGMGAHFALRIYERVELDPFLRRYPGTVLAAAKDGAVPVYEANLRGRVAFVLGNEGAGLSEATRRLAHRTIAIPMPGRVESLNVAAAAAVCLFERVRQQAAGLSRSA